MLWKTRKPGKENAVVPTLTHTKPRLTDSTIKINERGLMFYKKNFSFTIKKITIKNIYNIYNKKNDF